MKSITNNIRLLFSENGIPEITLTLQTNKYQIQTEYAELKEFLTKGKTLDVEITQHKKKRSLDANSYCFVICQKIAEKIHSTKELIYQKAIKEVGQFEIVPIKAEAVERWISVWNSKGLGWFSEVMEDSKLPGYKKVISYYGSSVYSVSEMSVLIDNIVESAKEMGIETLTPDEILKLKSSWKNK